MKKVLSLLLAFIFIFSCFSILGTSTALAEDVITPVDDSVKMKPDFTNATTSRWTATHSGDYITYHKDEKNESFVRVKGNGKENCGIRSTTFELIPENEYELTLYFRLDAYNGKTFMIGDWYYIPAFVFYETDAPVGSEANANPADSTNFYVYNQVRRYNDFNSEWNIEGLGTYSNTIHSNYNYKNHTKMVETLPESERRPPEEAYADWTKLTVSFTAVADEVGETAQNAAFAVYFNQYGSGNVNFSFDIKNVQLINKSVSGGASAPALKEGQAFFNDFKDGSVANIEADRSEIELVKDASDTTGATQYLKYVSNASSNGVGFNFANNPKYTYKISYDLNVMKKGSGELKTLISNTLLADHTNADSTDFKHYEFDFSDATAGDVKVKLLANATGWQVGIDNIKVEMISKANLENLSTITDGTYAFNIRTKSSEKQQEQGLRFKSKIDFNELNLTEGAKIVEYGTLVTVAANKANLKLENVDGEKVLKGMAFGDETDIRYSFEDNVLVYTGVITEINPQNYDKELAVCGYTVVETVSGARFTLYDGICEISVLAAAEQIVAEPQSEADKEAAQSVINEWSELNQ